METKNPEDDAPGGELGVDIDLLGHPLKPLIDPRGRPPYSKSKENQLLVATLAGNGWSQESIAEYLACDPKTLRKYYSRELKAGALMIEGLALQVLTRKMLTGSVSATQKLLDRVAGETPHGARRAAAAQAAQPPQGKKAQLEAAAHRAPEDPARAELLAKTRDLH